MSKEHLPYWQQRQQLKLGNKPEQKKAKDQDKKERGAFFAEAILKAPNKCENCGAPLAPTMAINAAAVVCHILPKRKKQGCPSVATHAMNKWYGCGDCHTNYDNKGEKFVKKMKVFPILRDRVAMFYHLIAPGELRRVPDYFRP